MNGLYPGKMFRIIHRLYYYEKKNDHKYKGCFEPEILIMCLDIDDWFEQAQFLVVQTSEKCWIPFLLFDCLDEILDSSKIT